MNKYGLTDRDVLELEKSIFELVQSARLYRSCITCAYFYETNENPELHEQCSRYGLKPPARVIAMGCDSWEEPPPF